MNELEVKSLWEQTGRVNRKFDMDLDEFKNRMGNEEKRYTFYENSRKYNPDFNMSNDEADKKYGFGQYSSTAEKSVAAANSSQSSPEPSAIDYSGYTPEQIAAMPLNTYEDAMARNEALWQSSPVGKSAKERLDAESKRLQALYEEEWPKMNGYRIAQQGVEGMTDENERNAYINDVYNKTFAERYKSDMKAPNEKYATARKANGQSQLLADLYSLYLKGVDISKSGLDFEHYMTTNNAELNDRYEKSQNTFMSWVNNNLSDFEKKVSNGGAITYEDFKSMKNDKDFQSYWSKNAKTYNPGEDYQLFIQWARQHVDDKIAKGRKDTGFEEVQKEWLKNVTNAQEIRVGRKLDQIKKRKQELQDSGKTIHPTNVWGAPMKLSDDEEKEYSDVINEYKLLHVAEKKYKDGMKTLNSPYHGDNGFKSFLFGMRDSMTDADFYTLGLDSIADFATIKPVIEKSKRGETLTDAETELIDSMIFQANAEAQRAGTQSNAYTGGKVAAESIPFMVEFLLTGGVGEFVTKKAITGYARRKAISAISKERGKDFLEKLGKEKAEDYIRKYATAYIKKSIGKKEIVDFALGTLAQAPLMPSTYKGMMENMSDKVGRENEDGTVTFVDENGNYQFRDGDSFAKSAYKVWKEVATEKAGFLFEGPAGKFFSGIAKGRGALHFTNPTARRLSKAAGIILSPKNSVLAKGGVSNIPGEAFEEVLGSGFDYVAGHIFQDEGMRQEAKDFWTADNWESMLLGFSLLPFGGTMKTVFGAAGARHRAKQSEADLVRMMSNMNIDSVTARDFMNELMETDVHKLSGKIAKFGADNNLSAQTQRKLEGNIRQYMAYNTMWNSYLDSDFDINRYVAALDVQMEDATLRREFVDSELLRMGMYAYKNPVDAEDKKNGKYVIATLNDGRAVFVTEGSVSLDGNNQLVKDASGKNFTVSDAEGNSFVVPVENIMSIESVSDIDNDSMREQLYKKYDDMGGVYGVIRKYESQLSEQRAAIIDAARERNSEAATATEAEVANDETAQAQEAQQEQQTQEQQETQTEESEEERAAKELLAKQQEQEAAQQAAEKEKTDFFAALPKKADGTIAVNKMSLAQKFNFFRYKNGVEAAYKLSTDEIGSLREQIKEIEANTKISPMDKALSIDALNDQIKEYEDLIAQYVPEAMRQAPAASTAETETPEVSEAQTTQADAPESAPTQEAAPAQAEAETKPKTEAEQKEEVKPILSQPMIDTLNKHDMNTEEVRSAAERVVTKQLSVKDFADQYLFGKCSLNAASDITMALGTKCGRDYLVKNTKFAELVDKPIDVVNDKSVVLFRLSGAKTKWMVGKKVGENKVEVISSQDSKLKQGDIIELTDAIKESDKVYVYTRTESKGKESFEKLVICNQGIIEGGQAPRGGAKVYTVNKDGRFDSVNGNDLYVIDKSGRFVHINRTGEEFKKMRVEELVSEANKIGTASNFMYYEILPGTVLFRNRGNEKKPVVLSDADAVLLTSLSQLKDTNIQDIKARIDDAIDIWNALVDHVGYDSLMPEGQTLKVAGRASSHTSLVTGREVKNVSIEQLLRSDAVNQLRKAMETVAEWRSKDSANHKEFEKLEKDAKSKKISENIFTNEKKSVPLQRDAEKKAERQRREAIIQTMLYSVPDDAQLPTDLKQRNAALQRMMKKAGFEKQVFYTYKDLYKFLMDKGGEYFTQRAKRLQQDVMIVKTQGTSLYGFNVTSLGSFGLVDFIDTYSRAKRVVTHEYQHSVFKEKNSSLPIHASEDLMREIIEYVSGSDFYSKKFIKDDIEAMGANPLGRKVGDYKYQGLSLRNEFLSHMMEVCVCAPQDKLSEVLSSLGLDEVTVNSIITAYNNVKENNSIARLLESTNLERRTRGVRKVNSLDRVRSGGSGENVEGDGENLSGGSGEVEGSGQRGTVSGAEQEVNSIITAYNNVKENNSIARLLESTNLERRTRGVRKVVGVDRGTSGTNRKGDTNPEGTLQGGSGEVEGLGQLGQRNAEGSEQEDEAEVSNSLADIAGPKRLDLVDNNYVGRDDEDDIMDSVGRSYLDDEERVFALNDLQQKDSLDDEFHFSVGKNLRTTFASWCRNNRPELGDDDIATAIEWLDTFDKSNVQYAAGYWFARGMVRIGEDDQKIKDAVEVARRKNVAPTSFASPGDILATYEDVNLDANKRINPDDVATLHKRNLSYAEGVSVYDVDDSHESMVNMREIINTHWGKKANPWCLLHGADDGSGDLADGQNSEYNAVRYWNHYSAYPKRVAFQNGKLLAFCANDNRVVLWWDRKDHHFYGIPITLKHDNGRTGQYQMEEDERGADSAEFTGIEWTGNDSNGEYTQYVDGVKRYTLNRVDGLRSGIQTNFDGAGNPLVEMRMSIIDAPTDQIDPETGEVLEEAGGKREKIDAIKFPFMEMFFDFEELVDGENCDISLTRADDLSITGATIELRGVKTTAEYDENGVMISGVPEKQPKSILLDFGLGDMFPRAISIENNKNAWDGVIEFRSNGAVDFRYGFDPYSDNTYSFMNFYPNGNMKRSGAFDEDGQVHREDYYGDGTMSASMERTRGGHISREYYPNGELKSEYVYDEYSTVGKTFDMNGNENIVKRIYDEDGNNVELRRYIAFDGSVIERVTPTRNIDFTFQKDSNGKLTASFKDNQLNDDESLITPEDIAWAIEQNPLLEGHLSEDGIMFSIGGKKGAAMLDSVEGVNTRLDNLELAVQMEVEGKTPLEIRLATGWERGFDDEWRYEIMDGEIEPLSNYTSSHPFTLSSFYHNSDLYNAYPILRNFPVLFTELDDNTRGSLIDNGNPNNSYIQINDKFLRTNESDAVRATLIHEIQHIIQRIEGFEPGASIEVAEDIASKVPESSKMSDYRFNYWNTSGEVEARSASKRALLSAEERLSQLIINTEMAPEDQYLLSQALINLDNKAIDPFIGARVRTRAGIEYLRSKFAAYMEADVNLDKLYVESEKTQESAKNNAENLHMSENSSNFATNKKYEDERKKVRGWLQRDATGGIQARSLQSTDGSVLGTVEWRGQSGRLGEVGSREVDGGLRNEGDSGERGLSNSDGIVSYLPETNAHVDALLSDRGIKAYNGKVYQVDAKTFYEAINEYKSIGIPMSWCVDVHSIDGESSDHPYVECICLLSEDGKSGIAVTEQGDVVSLFSSARKEHRLDKLVPMAIALGGKTADFYTTDKPHGLQNMYAGYGMKVTGQTPFNTEFAPEDWDGNADHTVGAGYFPNSVDDAITFKSQNQNLVVDLSSVPTYIDKQLEDGSDYYGYDQMLDARNEESAMSDDDMMFSVGGVPEDPFLLPDSYIQFNERSSARAAEKAKNPKEEVKLTTAAKMSWYTDMVHKALDRTEHVRILQDEINEWRLAHGKRKMTARYNIRGLIESAAGAKDARLRKLDKHIVELTDTVKELCKIIDKSELVTKYAADKVKEPDGSYHKLTSYELLERYIIARESIDRNDVSGNPRGEIEFEDRMGLTMPDYVAEFHNLMSQHQDLVRELWKNIKSITNASLEAAKDGGLISDVSYDEYKKRKFYVPQKGSAEKDAMGVEDETPMNRRLKAAGFAYQAKGGASLANNVIAYMIHDAQDSIVKAENNKIKQAMARLLNANKDWCEAIELDVPYRVWYVRNEETGEYEKTTEEPSREIREENIAILKEIEALEKSLRGVRKKEDREVIEASISLKKKTLPILSSKVIFDRENNGLSESSTKVTYMENGEVHQLSFDLSRLGVAQALNGVTSEADRSNINKFVRNFSAYTAAMFTTYNFAFAPVNLTRDVMWVTAKGAVEYGFEFEARFAKDMLDPNGSIVQIGRWLRGTLDESTPEGQLFMKFIMNGGQTGMTQLDDLKEIRNKVEGKNQFGGTALQILGLGPVAPFISEFSELWTRFATFRAVYEMKQNSSAYKAGRINDEDLVREAVDAAKNLGVNFNRRGFGSKFLGFFNSLSMFCTPAIQGAAGFWRTFDSKEKVHKALIYLCAVPAFAGMLATMMFMDDDDDEYFVPLYERYNYIVLGDVRIPVAEQVKPFWIMGVNIAMMSRGKMEWGEAVRSQADAIAQYLLPIAPTLSGTIRSGIGFVAGEDVTLADVLTRTVTPEAYSGIIDLGLNQTSYGSSLTSYNYNDMPQFELGGNEADLFQQIAYAEYRLGGGNTNFPSIYKYGADGEKIDIDRNPKQIKAIWSNLPSGDINLLCMMFGLGHDAYDLAKGDFDETHVRFKDIPVVNRFYRPSDVHLYRYNVVKPISDKYEGYMDTYESRRKEVATLENSRRKAQSQEAVEEINKQIDGIKKELEDMQTRLPNGIDTAIKMTRLINEYKKNNLYYLSRQSLKNEEMYKKLVGKDRLAELDFNEKEAVENIMIEEEKILQEMEEMKRIKQIEEMQ